MVVAVLMVAVVVVVMVVRWYLRDDGGVDFAADAYVTANNLRWVMASTLHAHKFRYRRLATPAIKSDKIDKGNRAQALLS